MLRKSTGPVEGVKTSEPWLEHLVGRLGGAGRKIFLQLFPIHRPLGGSLVAGGINELSKLGIGHRLLIDSESIDRNLVRGLLVSSATWQIASHFECSTCNPNHADRTSL